MLARLEYTRGRRRFPRHVKVKFELKKDELIDDRLEVYEQYRQHLKTVFFFP